MQVNTKPIFKDGSANTEWALEQAKINGNKSIIIVLEAQPADQNADIPLAIISQKDENGQDVAKFTYDNTTNLLTPTADIPNVKVLKFHHLITYTGSSSSGGNNDANNVLEINQRIVDSDAGITVIEEIDKISSAINLAANETIQVRKVTEPDPQADQTVSWGISSLIGLGWSLRAFNTPIITCTNIRITIAINYYASDAEGGN